VRNYRFFQYVHQEGKHERTVHIRRAFLHVENGGAV
jgi:hypothetical protein